MTSCLAKRAGILLTIALLLLPEVADAAAKRKGKRGARRAPVTKVLKAKKNKPQPPPVAEPTIEEAAATEAATEQAPEIPAPPVEQPAPTTEDVVSSPANEETKPALLLPETSAVTATHEQQPPLVDPRDKVDGTKLRVSTSIEVGVGFAQALSKLGTTPIFGLEVGLLLPVLRNQLAVVLNASYVQPKYELTETDARLTAGTVSTTLQERRLAVGLGGMYRILPLDSLFNFYGQAALQLHLQRSGEESAAGGVDLGSTSEQKSTLGAMVAAGAEYRLPVGALAAELAFEFAKLTHRMTGDTLEGGPIAQVGYHLIF